MTTSRPYTDDDLSNLQHALASWIQEAGDCGYCHVGDVPHRIYNGLRGRLPRHEAVRLWEDSGEIVAYVLASPFFNVFDAYVSPTFRGTEVEREAVLWGNETTRRLMDAIGKQDKSTRVEHYQGDDVRQKILEELGFEFLEHWGNHTERSLADSIPEPVVPEGFTIRPAKMEEYAQLAEVHNGAFNPNWTPELYRDEVMLKPGYEVEREIVVVAPNGRFAAFTKTWLDTVNRVGLFEPVGTHKDFHRQGLGKAVMLYALHEMKSLGLEYAHVGHEVSNPASTGLYNSLGFCTKYEIYDYKKV